MPVILEDLTQQTTCAICGTSVIVEDSVWYGSSKLHISCADSDLLEDMRKGFSGVMFHVEHESKKLLLPYSKKEAKEYTLKGSIYTLKLGNSIFKGKINGGVVWLYLTN